MDEIRSGKGIDLLDLIGGRRIQLANVKASWHVDRGDLMLAWVVSLHEGDDVTGAVQALPTALRDEVVAWFAEERAELRARHPELTEDALTVAAVPGVQECLRQRARERKRAPHASGPARAPSDSWRAALDPPPEPASEEPEPPRQPRPGGGQAHTLPPLAHEVMVEQVPPLAGLVPALARTMRADPTWSPTRTFSPSEFADFPGLMGFLKDYAVALREQLGYSEQVCAGEATFLAHHVHYMAHYEAHYRKTFWVDESLAFMLRQTHLDIVGAYLRPPFPACAFARDPASPDGAAESTAPDATHGAAPLLGRGRLLPAGADPDLADPAAPRDGRDRAGATGLRPLHGARPLAPAGPYLEGPEPALDRTLLEGPRVRGHHRARVPHEAVTARHDGT